MSAILNNAAGNCTYDTGIWKILDWYEEKPVPPERPRPYHKYSKHHDLVRWYPDLFENEEPGENEDPQEPVKPDEPVNPEPVEPDEP
jgi:hypothetical protein